MSKERYRDLDESWHRWYGKLSPRVMKLLRAYGLTIEEAAAMSDRELLQIPMFGKHSLRELRAAVADSHSAL